MRESIYCCFLRVTNVEYIPLDIKLKDWFDIKQINAYENQGRKEWGPAEKEEVEGKFLWSLSTHLKYVNSENYL